MDASPDQDLTRSPEMTTPSARPLPATRSRDIKTVESHSPPESPLGTTEKPSDSHQNGNGAVHSPGVKTNGFPFDVAPGTTGQSVTNNYTDEIDDTDNAVPDGRNSAEKEERLDQATRLPSSNAPTKRQSSGDPESSTPPGRRSVQFARPSTIDTAGPSHSRRPSQPDITEEAEETEAKDKQAIRLFDKLKALATPISLHGHSKSFSGWTLGDSTNDVGMSSGPGSNELDYTEHESEADADGEDSATEDQAGSSSRPKQRTRRKSRRTDESHTAPTTPRATTSRMAPWSRDSPGDTPIMRPHGFFRRATMEDIPENQRQHVSEDEGRARLAKQGMFRRGTSWVPGHRNAPDSARPSHLRRFTGINGGSGLEESPMRRNRADRHPSIGAMRWRQIKAGLKLLGTKKKEDKVDSTKSAELLAELLAGAPAALFLASMFQRDDKGHKRVPVLLEQLKVRVVDSQRVENKPGDRHVVFRIELEYGSGPTRMKWVIHRTLRDFANLHLKYKIQSQTDKYIQLRSDDKSQNRLPRFPKSAFPYLRGVRGFADDEDDEDEDMMPPEPGTDAEASGTDRPGRRNGNGRRQSSFPFMRRRSSITNAPVTPSSTVDPLGSNAGVVGPAGLRRETYAERQRRRLEQYLQQMITTFMFRPDGNRLCKFLELSALGVRLAAEGGYHGKEGYMVIASNRGLDFRKTRFNPSHFKERHSPKWFLVRHSYIVCVDSPEEMNVYDVLLVDSQFTTEKKSKRKRDETAQELARRAKEKTKYPTHHQLRIFNAERSMKLLARNERQLHQFEESVNFMMRNTVWSQEHRFDSFAPVRKNVFAQWLVDGRDYMWNVSRAISMAKDVIYIHDWWLSPELYLRRPAAISQKWRLDRLLQRKAQEGVKIFIIVYRNINSAIPIDSEYTKFSLLDLHPNVFVQRSPNQFRQNTFFWSHHEKICVVDHLVAFCGGVDLCYGRWDTPGHSVVDDKLTGFELNDMPKDADHCQLWPGKDYSNPRVQDFYALDKPYEEMYDRGKIPRMPWHDIGMQIVGQPARDLTRHFIQRWNYILRQRKPSRPTPFLLPPRDFIHGEIESLGLEGTCEIQILRSAGEWSLGLNRTENSIENAYVKMIEKSEHFMYMENQFFITSCNMDGTIIENRIGDAIVERIKRAHVHDEDWRAIIVIPLMPGYQNTVDSPEGSSVRLIMQCQYRSICRGETSIFGKLRAAGIEPEDYIQFYALRSWGKIGPDQGLVTEQLYIHAKAMIVDDRVAIIGSANINERSMRGNRDSEVAAIIRDRELVSSTMAGEPYMVGKFPSTLRMRLMREHLGIDTDAIMERQILEEQLAREEERLRREDEVSLASQPCDDVSERWPSMDNDIGEPSSSLSPDIDRVYSYNHDIDWGLANPNLKTHKKVTSDPRVTGNEAHARDVRGEGHDRLHDVESEQPDILAGRDSYVDETGREVLASDIAAEPKQSPKKLKLKGHARQHRSSTASRDSRSVRLEETERLFPPPEVGRLSSRELGLPTISTLPALPVTDDTDIGGPALGRTLTARSADVLYPHLSDLKRPVITEDCMRDPLNDSFYLDVWHAAAEDNTKVFREVFRCMPDNQVKTWKEYQEYTAFAERFAQVQGQEKSKQRVQHERRERTGGPPGNVPGGLSEKAVKLEQKVEGMTEKVAEPFTSAKNRASPPMGTVDEWTEEQERNASSRATDRTLDEKEAMKAEAGGAEEPKPVQRERTITIPGTANAAGKTPVGKNSTRRRRRGTTRSSTRAFHAQDDSAMMNKTDAEELLKHVQGHLVVWPYDWLEKEERGGGWLYATDQIAPLEIYT
ncbi:phospholipase D [Eremomyces bilateralis CBS 781.70]|uniref:Phospholipase D1 n=1 Tax=Eremomyces bilateralis CBS 781.70 TaxID=1392243 RepID=A0A6G1G6D8_9PEZI|nr:phospholipase D [Eremomyces bilateralis CBS 781.70]KAF1813399.1 phospholipase D [Eremomyces bilateralis CBS 781.70]